MPLRFSRDDAPEPKQVRASEIAILPYARQFPSGTEFHSARAFNVDRPVRVEALSPAMLRTAMALEGTPVSRDTAMLTGLVVPYAKPSSDPVPVMFRAGCFGQSVKGDLRMSFNFSGEYSLGRRSAGTFELSDEEDGLYFECLPPETSWGSGLLVSIERGDIRGIVAACQVTQQHVERDRRIIERAVLLGVAISSFYGWDTGIQITRSKQDDDTGEADASFLRTIGIAGGRL